MAAEVFGTPLSDSVDRSDPNPHLFGDRAPGSPRCTKTFDLGFSDIGPWVQIESDPAGADIEVDGSFVGNTPSDVQVTEGEHTVRVKKAGFKDWERKLKISGGSSVNLSSQLEKLPGQ